MRSVVGLASFHAVEVTDAVDVAILIVSLPSVTTTTSCAGVGFRVKGLPERYILHQWQTDVFQEECESYSAMMMKTRFCE